MKWLVAFSLAFVGLGLTNYALTCVVVWTTLLWFAVHLSAAAPEEDAPSRRGGSEFQKLPKPGTTNN